MARVLPTCAVVVPTAPWRAPSWRSHAPVRCSVWNKLWRASVLPCICARLPKKARFLLFPVLIAFSLHLFIAHSGSGFMAVSNTSADALFVLLGGIMVLAMHAGFAFLELGTVRKKNQVNALVKILVDFAVSTIAYFFIGYSVAYGVNFFASADVLANKNGYELVKFFFLLTFAAAVPAIISGGIAERAKFYPQLVATALLVGFVYPLYEGIAWNHRFGIQGWLNATFSAEFHDFAGSVVVHAVGGWVALPAVLLLGARTGRYKKDGAIAAHPPSSIPFLALGAWILTVGWFGFNVMSAQSLEKMNG